MENQKATTPLNLRGITPLLQVFDMPASLKFYRDMLGFHIVQSSGLGDELDWVLLRLNDIELMLNTAYEKPNRPASPSASRMTAHSDTEIYVGCPDIDATYEALIKMGIDVNPPVITSYKFKALYLVDPDRFQLVLHWPM